MSFAAPAWLLLLPLCFWWFFRRRKRPSLGVPSLLLWPASEGVKSRYLFLVPLFQSLACAMLVLALARPQSSESDAFEVREGIAIELLIDVSSSMDMTMESQTEKRSRMEVAKELVERFILGDDQDLAGRPDDLIGLITFARYADTRSPLTTGHEALAQIVRNLTIQERPNEDGTAYGDALALAAARLHHLSDLAASFERDYSAGIASKVVILLTDGENNSGKHLPEEAGGLAQAWGVRVYTISLADVPPEGSPPETLNPAEQVLQHISRETGGLFRQAHDFESLKAVYREIDDLERTEMKTRSLERIRERFPLPLTLALLFAPLAFILEATWLRSAP